MFKIIRNIGCRILTLACDSKLHTLLTKLILLFVPVLMGLGFIEYQLSKVPVGYSQKKHKLEHRLDKIEVLVLGSSNAYFGINPNYFSHSGFNFAYRAQWPYYDYKLLEKYLNDMPQLKMVIYPVIYFILGTQLPDIADFWRAYFYEQYYGIPPNKSEKLNLFKRLDARHFSKIALFGERTKEYLLHGTNVNEREADEDKLGWFNAGTKPCDLKLNIGPTGAKAHNVTVSISTFTENLVYIENIAKMLKAKNIQLIIVELPQHSVYTKYLDPIKYAAMEKQLHQLATKYQLQYKNYLQDKRFTLQDFTDMPDHLNANGAKKISTIINKEIIVPALKGNVKKSV